VLTTAFAHNLVQAWRRPSHQTLGVLLIVVLLLAGFAIALRRLFQRQRNE
jgi:Ni,Fe-hydrogenase I cytochrome b subunit